MKTLTILRNVTISGSICGMATWFTHMERLCNTLKIPFIFLDYEEGVSCLSAVEDYIEDNTVLIISMEDDWIALRDKPYDMYFYFHNAYFIYERRYWTRRDESYDYFLSSLDKVIVPTKRMQELVGGRFLPQPYMTKNINKHLDRSGLLILAGDNHEIKGVSEAEFLYRDITILTDSTKEEVADAMQSHSALLINSRGETGCYAALEANGIIPIYVNKKADWYRSFLVPVIRIKFTRANIKNIKYHEQKEDIYMNEVIREWSTFLEEILCL